MQGGCLYSPCSRRLPSTSPLPHCARASIRHQSRSTRPACLSGGSTITPPSQCGLRLHASSSRSCPARPHRSVSSHCGRVHVWPQPAQCLSVLGCWLTNCKALSCCATTSGSFKRSVMAAEGEGVGPALELVHRLPLRHLPGRACVSTARLYSHCTSSTVNSSMYVLCCTVYEKCA